MPEEGISSLNANTEEDITLEQVKDEYSEAVDIFPALHKYKNSHSSENLQKLCVEIYEFCRSIYASTQNEDERDIFRNIIGKILK